MAASPRLARGLVRGSALIWAAWFSGACLIPEYRIDDEGSGGTNGDGGTGDGSGGGTQSGSGGGGLLGAGGRSSGGAPGSGASDAGGGGPSGGGGVPSAWSCAEEESDLPSYYSNGTLCGYRFAFGTPSSGAYAPTFSPPCTDMETGSDCFRDGYEFLTGTVPASAPTAVPPVYPTVGVGMHLAQASATGSRGEFELIGYGLAVDYAAIGPARPLRIQLTSEGEEEEETDVYCATAARSAPLAWEDFRLDCWDPASTETLQAGDFVRELQLAVTSTDAPQTIDELDLEEITLLASRPPVSCDGCARLFVPLADAGNNVGSEFLLNLGDEADFSDDDLRIVVRVLVETTGTSGGLQIILRDASGESAYFWHQLAEVKGWYDLVIAPAEAETSSDLEPGAVEWIGLQVTSGEPPTGSVVGDVTVYVDSITFTGPSPINLDDFTFSDSLEGLYLETESDLEGSTLEWVGEQ